MKIKKIKKKNPQDATLRNINALKKRVNKLEVQFVRLINDLANKVSNDGY